MNNLMPIEKKYMLRYIGSTSNLINIISFTSSPNEA